MSTEEYNSLVRLGLGLHAKWKRDSSLSLLSRVEKATSYLIDLTRARVYLRQADEVASDVRVIRRPLVHSDGQLMIGSAVVLRSIVAPIEIYVGPSATMIIGNGSHLNSGCTLAAMSHVEIGERVEMAPHVTIYDTSFHSLYERNRAPEPRRVVVEDDVWLGTKCTVLPGVRIGRGAVVMANSLVTRNVEPFTIVSGVPAVSVAQLDQARFVVQDDGRAAPPRRGRSLLPD